MVNTTEYKSEAKELITPANIVKRMRVTITGVREVQTKLYGKKLIADVNGDRSVFLNATSVGNISEAYGDETDNWTDKKLDLKTIVMLIGKEEKNVIMANPVK